MAAAVAAYRNLLRAVRIAFEGDVTMLNGARTAARDQFQSTKGLVAGSDQATAALNHARSVTKILRENVVQGRNVGGEQYKLNIHEHTERGDNETARKMNKRVQSFADMKA